MNFDGLQLERILLMLPSVLIGFTVHEYAHAFSAWKLGDPTAKEAHRLTLNPLRHIDISGFFLLLFAGFGWARPVPVNEANFKNPLRDNIICSLAGPFSNLSLAFLATALLKLLFLLNGGAAVQSIAAEYLLKALYYFIWINIVLGIFNLLPIAPLDGSRVLMVFLPAGKIRENFFKIGPVILIAWVLLDRVLPFTIFPLAFLVESVFSFFSLLVGLPAA